MRRIIGAIGLALGTILLSYLAANIPYPFLDSWGTLAFAELIGGNHSSDSFLDDSVFCVNTAFDKQLAEVTSPEGFTRGTLDVTDRSKLIRLLKIAHEADYRYIFLDIRFPAGLRTENDEELFSLIREMPRVLVSRHSDKGFTIADSTLLGKAALADYRMTAFTGFTRYQYLQKGGESVALRMYKEMDQGDIRRYGPFYFSRERLCRNAQYIRIPRSIMERQMDNNRARYPYWGSQLLAYYTDEELVKGMKGRILLVGDFDHDLHSSYVGDVPGAMLSFMAWWELHKGKHTLSYCYIFLLLGLYSFLYLMLLRPHGHWYEYVPILKKIKPTFWRFILSLFGWGFVFYVFQVLLYCFSDISLSVTVPTMLFSIISEFFQFKEEVATI